MSISPRRQKKIKRKFAVYILLLGLLGVSSVFLNIFYVSKKPLFISPIGKINMDRASVEKILKDNNILFLQVSLSDNFYLVNILDNGQVMLSLNKDMNSQISSLQRILRELTIERKTFKTIDFRFEEPIISF